MSAWSPDHLDRQPPGPAVRSPDGLPDLLRAGMYVMDDNGSIVSVNARAKELLGVAADELVGRDAHELLHRDHLGQTVPRLADRAIVDLITESDDVWRTTVTTHHDGVVARREELEGPLPPVHEESFMPLSRALRGAASALAGPETYQGPTGSGITAAQQKLFQVTGLRSAAIAPVRGPRAVLGALTLGLSDRPGAFTDAELSLLEDIARRAGPALENACLYQCQRHIAETVQRHLLPRIPEVPGRRMAARYESASQSAQVGGDWYDVFSLSDGSTAVSIEDVVGHDIDAAAGMAQVRNMLRAYAWAREEPPGAIVERLDQAVVNVAEVSMASDLRPDRAERGRVDAAVDQRRASAAAADHPRRSVPVPGRGTRSSARHGPDTGAYRHAHRTPATVHTHAGHGRPDRVARAHARPGPGPAAPARGALAHRPLHVFCDLPLERARPVDNDDDIALLVFKTPAEGGEAGDR